MGFFNDIVNPGVILLITATMRGGKSNLASNLIEQAIKLGYNVYTNILFFKYKEIDEAIEEGILKQKKNYYWRKPEEIHIVTKLSELILGLNKTRKNFTILDESQIFFSSKKGVGKDIRYLEGFITQSGKFDTAICFIAQFKSKLGTMLKEDAPTIEFKVFKKSFYNRYFEIWFNPQQSEDNFEDPIKLKTVKHIPPSHYPYDHLAPAGFDIDIDVEEFVNRISKMNSLLVRKQIPFIIKEMLFDQKPIKKKKLSKKELVIDKIKIHPDESNKSIATICKCDESYISKIRKQLDEL
ncbi:MAG: zonular occludens toxin domain-containing protein [Promethearchaeota archaeon]